MNPKPNHYFAERQRLSEQNRALKAEIEELRRKLALAEACGLMWKRSRLAYNRLFLAIKERGIDAHALEQEAKERWP